jgi:hypothetical protein
MSRMLTTLAGEPATSDDQATWGRSTIRFEAEKVLVRWHNIIACMELSPRQPTDLLLTTRRNSAGNIEAVATEQD